MYFDEGRFSASGDPSFVNYLRHHAPELLTVTFDPAVSVDSSTRPHVEATTILALKFAGGAVMAGDRRATMGTGIFLHTIRKVFPVDQWSAVGFAGSASPAMRLARLYATEVEAYEKIEGVALTLQGKANKLGHMIFENVPAAMQGLAAIPLFVGYEPGDGSARIYEFDVTGGPYDQGRFASLGSGSLGARGSLKARYRTGLGEDEAVNIAIGALWDAADEDSATGGFDVVRDIYPQVMVIDADGCRELANEEVARHVEDIVADRRM